MVNTVPAAIFIRDLILSSMWPKCVRNISGGYLGQQQSAGPVITLRSTGFIIEFFEKPADLRKQIRAFLENLKRNIERFAARSDMLFLTHNLLHDYEIQRMTGIRFLAITRNKVFLS